MTLAGWCGSVNVTCWEIGGHNGNLMMLGLPASLALRLLLTAGPLHDGGPDHPDDWHYGPCIDRHTPGRLILPRLYRQERYIWIASTLTVVYWHELGTLAADAA